MAIFCLSKDLTDLEERIGNITIAYNKNGKFNNSLMRVLEKYDEIIFQYVFSFSRVVFLSPALNGTHLWEREKDQNCTFLLLLF